jgi:hypothetical protein
MNSISIHFEIEIEILFLMIRIGEIIFICFFLFQFEM